MVWATIYSTQSKTRGNAVSTALYDANFRVVIPQCAATRGNQCLCLGDSVVYRSLVGAYFGPFEGALEVGASHWQSRKRIATEHASYD